MKPVLHTNITYSISTGLMFFVGLYSSKITECLGSLHSKQKLLQPILLKNTSVNFSPDRHFFKKGQ